jgi:peptide/nickel transport system substrate-binding protein
MGLARKFSAISLAATLSVPLALPGLQVLAQTPPGILVIAAQIDDITSLDPQEILTSSGSDLANNLYGSLVSFDPADLSKGTQPDIAESWEISGDGKVFTFSIRPGLTFTTGNPVTARDVEFSLRRAVAMEKSASPNLTRFGFTADNMGETLVALDDSTFRLTTDRKYAPSFVLNSLTATIAYIVDSKIVKAREVEGDWGNAWLRTKSAGSDAYSLMNWQPGQSYTLKANPGYYRGEPAMKRVYVRNVQDSATQRLLLERGDIDIARNLGPEEIAAVSVNPGIAVDSAPRGRILYFSMNQSDPILSNPKVVEALKYLVDYEGMANSFLKGRYTVHQAFLPLTFLGALEETPYSLDLEKAGALLAEAGYVNGFDVEIIVGPAALQIGIARSLQNTFGQAGVRVSIAQGSGTQTLSKYRAREFQIYVGAWAPGSPDPHASASAFAHNPDNRPEADLAGNLAWRNSWDNPEMTAATEAAVAEADTARRAQMYMDIQRQHQQVAPFAPMFQKIEQTGRQFNVTGFFTGSAITSASYWTVSK